MRVDVFVDVNVRCTVMVLVMLIAWTVDLVKAGNVRVPCAFGNVSIQDPYIPWSIHDFMKNRRTRHCSKLFISPPPCVPPNSLCSPCCSQRCRQGGWLTPCQCISLFYSSWKLGIFLHLFPKSKCISLSYSLKVKALSHVVAKKNIIDTKLSHIVVV